MECLISSIMVLYCEEFDPIVYLHPYPRGERGVCVVFWSNVLVYTVVGSVYRIPSCQTAPEVRSVSLVGCCRQRLIHL